jgi:hypothetical protein
MVRASTDAEPTTEDDGSGTLQVGQELLYYDTGKSVYWDGSAWKPVTLVQRIVQLIDMIRDIRCVVMQQGE